MPQFDQYGMGVLVIASVVVLGYFYYLFITDYEASVKMVLGMRERLVKSFKKFMRDIDLAHKAGGSDANFYDEFLDERIKAAKRGEQMMRKLTKSSSEKAEKKAK